LSYNLSRKLFSVGDVDFSCEDFLEALDFFGVLSQWKIALQTGMMSCQHAEQQDGQLDRELIQNWSREFRYSMDLLGVAEFTSWLSLNGFEKKDLESYLIRRFWVDSFGDDVDAIACKEEIDERLIFSDIYFSGSFATLLQSWQKRVLTWYDVHGGDFPSLQELENHFEEYSQKLRLQLDVKEWLKIREQDLTIFTLDCVVCKGDSQETFRELSLFTSYENKVKELDLESFKLQEFYKDLPEEISLALPYISKKGLTAPIIHNGQTLIIHLSSKEAPSIEDTTIRSLLFDEFSSEVWKTLTVKYVR
jgi:hypothetical protein